MLKCRRRVSRKPSLFYNPSWLIDVVKFPAAVSRFEKIIANSSVIDSSLQQSITNAVSSAVTTAIAAIQTKLESEMLSLREMIKKSLLLTDSASATPTPDLNATSKALPGDDSLPKAFIERWNQADLG